MSSQTLGVVLMVGSALGGVWLVWGASALWRVAEAFVPSGQEGREETWSQRLIGAFLLLLLTMVGLSSLGRLYRLDLLLVSCVLAAAAIAYGRLSSHQESGSKASSQPFISWNRIPPALRLPAVSTVAVVAVDLLLFLPAPPVDWDAMTYHLYLPLRWIQEGQWFHVPTVFGDNAAAFAPQNGAMVFAWLMTLTGSDALTNVVQVIALIFVGVSVFRGARCLGVRDSGAALAGFSLLWLTPIRQLAYSANVDLFLLASWFGAVSWILHYQRSGQRSALVWAGLAGGLAAGTKVVGLPMVGFLGFLLAPSILVWRRWRDVVFFLWPAAGVGSGWYLANLVLYGNPLFPLRVEFGPLVFPGAYGSAALRAGEFHISESGVLLQSVARSLGIGPCLWALLGWGILVLSPRFFPKRQHAATRGSWLGLQLLGLGWATFFTLAVPHNNQARFLLPIFLLAGFGWALALDAFRDRGRLTVFGGWVLSVVLASGGSPLVRQWLGIWMALKESEAFHAWWTIPALSLLSFGVLWFVRSWPLRRWFGTAALTLLVPLAATAADQNRSTFLSRSDFQAWAPGFISFSDPAAPPLRIAYTGANFPYALSGSGFRHRVVYVNTQGDLKDGFYQFWQGDSRVFDYHKPGLYRGHDDISRWLEHLKAEGIELLVIFRLHKTEARYIQATPEGFPIEQIWVQQNPEIFVPIARHPVAEIYRVDWGVK